MWDSKVGGSIVIWLPLDLYVQGRDESFSETCHTKSSYVLKARLLFLYQESLIGSAICISRIVWDYVVQDVDRTRQNLWEVFTTTCCSGVSKPFVIGSLYEIDVSTVSTLMIAKLGTYTFLYRSCCCLLWYWTAFTRSYHICFFSPVASKTNFDANKDNCGASVITTTQYIYISHNGQHSTFGYCAHVDRSAWQLGMTMEGPIGALATTIATVRRSTVEMRPLHWIGLDEQEMRQENLTKSALERFSFPVMQLRSDRTNRKQAGTKACLF